MSTFKINTLFELKDVISTLENRNGQMKTVEILQKDETINWRKIRQEAALEQGINLENLAKRPYESIVRHLATPGVWTHGGDRKSSGFRDAKQRRLVQFVAKRAQAAAVAEEMVVAQTIQEVAHYWRSCTPEGSSAQQQPQGVCPPVEWDTRILFTAPQSILLCQRCRDANLLDKLNGDMFSDVVRKNGQRAFGLRFWQQHPRRHTAAVFALDHPLPALAPDGVTVDPDAPPHLFLDDLLEAARADGGRPFDVQAYFSPNIDASVVGLLRARGVIHTHTVCADRFLQVYAPVIRDHFGGLILGFFDACGGFFGPLGPAPLVELSVNLRLYEPTSPALVFFTASDRFDRTQHDNRVQTRVDVEHATLGLLTRDHVYAARSVTMPPDVPSTWGRTMQSYQFLVQNPYAPLLSEEAEERVQIERAWRAGALSLPWAMCV